MPRAPISGELLQVEYAWLVVEYERLVTKLGLCCMSPAEHARVRATIERCRNMALPAALRSAGAIDVTVSMGTGRVLGIDGEPWAPDEP